VGGAHKDPVSDMSFHGRLQGLCVLGHSLPVRTGPIKSLRDRLEVMGLVVAEILVRIRLRRGR
jgi:hypothetical protein